MSRRRKHVDLRGASRRDFIRWGIYTGGLLGLRPWRVLEVFEDTGGQALAASACASTNRSVHLLAGVGGFAWFQLLWPHVDVALAQNDGFAYHAPGQGGLLAGADHPLYLSPQAPWQRYGAAKAVTAFMAGSNETHTLRPTSSSTLATGVGLFAACAALQAASPTLVPVIGVGNPPFGAAPGAPALTAVPSADELVGLFDSAASRVGGVLANPGDASVYEAYTKALLGLEAAAGRPTMKRSYQTAKVATNLLGRNLSSQLQPSGDDFTRYGVDPTTPSKLIELAKGLITTAKAFRLGLTSSVLLPAMQDDPHGAFASPTVLLSTITTLGKILDAFMDDLMAQEDPTCAGRKLGDNVVLTVHGDTPKNPLDRDGWPDGTPGASNWMYVLGAGLLKTGWFGGIRRDGSAVTFDPDTGIEVAARSDTTAMAAAAGVAYAVARGDMRRVNDFYRGSTLAGITRPAQQ
jgi:hypothetical protein